MLEQHGTDKTRLLQATIWVKHMKDRVVPEWARSVFASHPQARVATASEQSDNNREESNAIVQIRCLYRLAIRCMSGGATLYRSI
jgi:hypothetical protein